jgi:hypothetical protein
MVTKFLVVIALSAPVLAGQGAKDARFDETEFRKAVKDGLLPDAGDRPMFFALKHEEIAAPILVAEIKAKLDDPNAEYFIRKAADLAVYQANQRAVDVVADLCQTDQKRFSWLVEHVLNHAVGWQREFELAYYAVDRYPHLRGLVKNWAEEALKLSRMDLRLARELLKREKAGHLIRPEDPLLSLLAPETREIVYRAVETARIEEVYHHNE